MSLVIDLLSHTGGAVVRGATLIEYRRISKVRRNGFPWHLFLQEHGGLGIRSRVLAGHHPSPSSSIAVAMGALSIGPWPEEHIVVINLRKKIIRCRRAFGLVPSLLCVLLGKATVDASGRFLLESLNIITIDP